jgi:hypothetical protein
LRFVGPADGPAAAAASQSSARSNDAEKAPAFERVLRACRWRGILPFVTIGISARSDFLAAIAHMYITVL